MRAYLMINLARFPYLMINLARLDITFPYICSSATLSKLKQQSSESMHEIQNCLTTGWLDETNKQTKNLRPGIYGMHWADQKLKQACLTGRSAKAEDTKSTHAYRHRPHMAATY
jgi:hypothetical protein